MSCVFLQLTKPIHVHQQTASARSHLQLLQNSQNSLVTSSITSKLPAAAFLQGLISAFVQSPISYCLLCSHDLHSFDQVDMTSFAVACRLHTHTLTSGGLTVFEELLPGFTECCKLHGAHFPGLSHAIHDNTIQGVSASLFSSCNQSELLSLDTLVSGSV